MVADWFGQWPFLALQTVMALPVLLWFVRRQQQHNSLANACWHYGLFRHFLLSPAASSTKIIWAIASPSSSWGIWGGDLGVGD